MRTTSVPEQRPNHFRGVLETAFRTTGVFLEETNTLTRTYEEAVVRLKVISVRPNLSNDGPSPSHTNTRPRLQEQFHSGVMLHWTGNRYRDTDERRGLAEERERLSVHLCGLEVHPRPTCYRPPSCVVAPHGSGES